MLILQALQQFESLMALTNLAQMNDEVRWDKREIKPRELNAFFSALSHYFVRISKSSKEKSILTTGCENPWMHLLWKILRPGNQQELPLRKTNCQDSSFSKQLQHLDSSQDHFSSEGKIPDFWFYPALYRNAIIMYRIFFLALKHLQKELLL